MHEFHCHRPFAYCGGDTLGRATLHVARSKNARKGWSPAEMAGDEAATTPRSALRSSQTVAINLNRVPPISAFRLARSSPNALSRGGPFVALKSGFTLRIEPAYAPC